MNFNSKDYDLSREYQTRQQAVAAHRQQIEDVQNDATQTPISTRRILTFVVFGMVVLTLLITPHFTQAQSSRTLTDPGGSIGADIELALIMGDYYFDHGQYKKAIVQFETAIEAMPEQLYELMPAQAVVFWQLGEAQQQAGLHQSALASYQHFLELAGDAATGFATEYVTAFERSLAEIYA